MEKDRIQKAPPSNTSECQIATVETTDNNFQPKSSSNKSKNSNQIKEDKNLKSTSDIDVIIDGYNENRQEFIVQGPVERGQGEDYAVRTFLCIMHYKSHCLAT